MQTLYCGNTAADQIVQITRQSLRLIDAGTRQLTQEWRPPDGITINVAAASPTQARSVVAIMYEVNIAESSRKVCHGLSEMNPVERLILTRHTATRSLHRQPSYS